MDPMTIALAARAAAPILQGIGQDLATPMGATTSGQNVFDFGNWTVSTGRSRADATNTDSKPSTVSMPTGSGSGIDLNLVLIILVGVVIWKKVM